MKIPIVKMTVNASGAANAARQGDVVVIVDVIDMSTTLEAALDAGACAVFGAAPDGAAPPVAIDPAAIGWLAGQVAREKGTGVVLVAEPRVGTDDERLGKITGVTGGLARAGADISAVLPNIGAETPKLYDLHNQVVIAATATGGVAYDAAVCAGASAVLTGTVARTMRQKGAAPARAAAARAIQKARALDAGITVVAASGNSLEDVLAAEYITRTIIEEYLS
ncbi:hypothetical protein [Desulfoscipio gibsoniae]|uniref:2-phosphosulfolactate phosphatase n=1 Tax=Desulfoscipio gibsoniae DSM 7213 TaxID=767817 RepID=R4KK56_9FIRM|nr:hypothetical protein [Desulfoscipio gibsoniae]AGL01987.1 hypothetical protein Desgi_2581 [Desulfoscipio gibsoniae DSM 7213]